MQIRDKISKKGSILVFNDFIMVPLDSYCTVTRFYSVYQTRTVAFNLKGQRNNSRASIIDVTIMSAPSRASRDAPSFPITAMPIAASLSVSLSFLPFPMHAVFELPRV